jgi:hypothetical protein
MTYSVSILRRQVLRGEVLLRMLAQPHRKLRNLLTQTVSRLHIHVCLSNKLGHGAYNPKKKTPILANVRPKEQQIPQN